MKGKSLKRNAVLNSARVILRLLFSLISVPYVSRTLGVEGVGAYSFSASIVSYFSLIAQLGIESFAVREGAKYRENRKEFSNFASEIFTINAMSTLLSYILLFICLAFVQKFADYRLIIMILSMQIILNTLGCEWIYTIYEDFAYITYRTMLFQIISIVLLLTLVKTPNDLIKYSIIMVLSSGGNNILNFIHIKKYADIKLKITKNTPKYMAPILILFASNVTTTIYVSSDTTILGFLTDDFRVGLYSTSAKIYNMIKTILSSVIVVSIPRLSYLWGNEKKEEFKKLAESIINMLIITVLPVMTGVISIAYEILYIIAGKEYIQGTLSLQILGAALICSMFSWFYVSCILIPAKREKKVLVATIIAGLTNILLNFVLIPYFYQDAAAFTTFLAELISFSISYANARKIIKIDINRKNLVSAIVGCLGIFIWCYVIKNWTKLNIISMTIVSIAGAVIIYIAVELLMKNEIMMDLLKSMKGKFIKEKKEENIG